MSESIDQTAAKKRKEKKRKEINRVGQTHREYVLMKKPLS
jgi:hypothetical protein